MCYLSIQISFTVLIPLCRSDLFFRPKPPYFILWCLALSLLQNTQHICSDNQQHTVGGFFFFVWIFVATKFISIQCGSADIECYNDASFTRIHICIGQELLLGKIALDFFFFSSLLQIRDTGTRWCQKICFDSMCCIFCRYIEKNIFLCYYLKRGEEVDIRLLNKNL